jgi:hypothetical protein
LTLSWTPEFNRSLTGRSVLAVGNCLHRRFHVVADAAAVDASKSEGAAPPNLCRLRLLACMRVDDLFLVLARLARTKIIRRR